MRDWLASLGLGQYAEAFDEAAIDEEILADLTDADLASMGLPLGHRRKLLKAIAAITGRPSHAGSGSAAASPAAERRQLTVLFCDLVGSTALSGAMDPEALRGLMGRYHEACRVVVEKYAGQVAQYLGDGVMAYFGWPVAHEDDAERALRAGLELVAAVKRVTGAPSELQVRIGVATGPVVVGEGGEDSSAGGAGTPKLAVGETPNLAARLQGLAAPDEIVASAPTRRLAGGVFEVRDLGSHALKGVVDPVAAWQVLGLKQTEGRFEARRGAEQRLSALVGREQEVGLLAQKWAQACGGEGQVVLLEGEPGIGKSRITQWLLEHIGAGRHYRLRYQCSPYHAQSAFHPIIEQIERAAKFSPDDAAPVRLDKLQSLLDSPQPQSARTQALFAALLGVAGWEQRHGSLNLTPQKQKELTLQALTGHVTGLSRDAPVLLLMEDAHWIDPSTLESLGQSVDAVVGARVLVLITYRPEFKAQWTGQSHVSHVVLNRLNPGQTKALAEHVAGGHAMPEEIVAQIVQRTDGIPLFVEELTKAVLEAGLLELDAGANAYRLKGPLSPIAIPATLRDSLTARLDRLSPTKEVAQIGACIGREFGYGLLEKVAGLPIAQLTEALERLTESELVFQKGSPPEASYTFKHALIQDAAYDGLLKSRRAQIHARIAQVLDGEFGEIAKAQPEIVAHHWTEAGQWQVAIPLWLKAANLAIGRVAMTESLGHLLTALRLTAGLERGPLRDSLELECRLLGGVASMAAKGWAHPDVKSFYAPTIALAKTLDRESVLRPVYLGLSMNALVGTRISEAKAWVREGLETAERIDDDEMRLVSRMVAMAVEFWSGNLHRAAKHGEELLRLEALFDWRHVVHQYNHDPKTLWGIYASQWLWLMGYPERADRVGRDNADHARRVGHPFDLGFALGFGSSVFHFLGNVDLLLDRSAECAVVGSEHNLPFIQHLQAKIPLAFARTGSHAENVSAFRGVVEIFESLYVTVMLPYYRCLMAEQIAMDGLLQEALEIADAAIGCVEGPQQAERVYYAEMLRIRAALAQRKGEVAAAERLLTQAMEIARDQDAKSWELRTATSLARLMKSQGRTDGALAVLRPVYGWFTEGRDTKDHIEARQLLQELGG